MNPKVTTEIFIALEEVRALQASLWELTNRDRSDLIAPALLCPIERRLKTVQTALEAAHSHS